LPGGHYDFASGDSIATAHVSGVVALLLEKKRALSAAAAYQLLRDTSSRTEEGSGAQVDACAAVTGLMGRGSCRAADPDHRLAEKQDNSAILH